MKQKLLLTFLIIGYALTAGAQVSGTVFRDYNGNGVKNNTANYNEPFAADIIVNAYNSANVLIASYKSTATGYSIPASGTAYNGTPGSNTGFVPATTKVRLEFIIPVAGCTVKNTVDFSSAGAATYGSSVKFVTAGAAAININYAINNPGDYVKNSPVSVNDSLFITRYATGNPAGGGTSGTKNVFYKFAYTNKGNTATAAGVIEPPGAVALATNVQIGTCYGVGYSQRANKVFTAAVMKRHAGFGPANGTFNNAPGAIYLINPDLTAASPAASYFTSLDALGFPTHNTTGTPAYGSGTSYNIAATGANGYRTKVTYPAGGVGVIGNNLARGLPAASTGTSADPAALGQIGKVSLGDLDISEDGQFLYVTNLYDRKLYKLQLNSVTNPTSATVVGGYDLPNPPLRSASGITNAAATYTGLNDNTGFYDGTRGLQRPFGIGINRGKVYVGAVTTGEIAGTTTIDNNAGNPEYTDLWSYVYEFDPSTNTFSTVPILQTPLNFNRGTNGDAINESWKVWKDSIPAPTLAGSESATALRYVQYQQPILADIAFDADNTLILGFKDRFGDQTAYDEPSVNNLGHLAGQAMGDMHRAYFNSATCTFEFESAGKEGASSPKAATAGAANAQGPGGGEFYFRDHVYDGNDGTPDFNFHLNTLTGALANVRGTDSIAVASMDPQRAWSGGVSWFSNTTGDNGRDYEMFSGTGTGDFPGPPVGDAGKTNGLGDLEFLNALAPIEIGNRIWLDANGNGIQDADETTAGVATGTTVTLRSPGINGIYGDGDDQTWTTTTDANGNYYFSTLSSADNRKPASWTRVGNIVLPGFDYRIEVAIPGGVQITKVNVALNSVDNIDNDASLNGTNAIVAFNTGTTNHNFDIGFKPLATLGNKVWRDDNKDGVQDVGEPGVAGVTVTLKDNGGAVIGTTVTDAYGIYLFDNLAAASYTVTFTLPANYTFTTQTNTTDDNNTTGASTTGSDANITTGQTYTIVLSAGENNQNIDAGIIFNTPTAANSLGDKVWFDTNGNGAQDAGEPGVAGVTVTLYASNGTTVIATTVTDANGNYLFTNLPASTDYIVGISVPAGMVFTSTSGTTPGNATTNSDVNATLGSASYGKSGIVNTGVAGTQILGVDAGIIPQANNTASLGDKVWNDLNNNGTQDAGEPGIAGVTVNLYEDVNGDGVLTGGELVAVRTAVTDAFGYYMFNNLLPTALNKWQLEFVQPVGYVNTAVADNNSGNDATDSDITNNATDRTGFIHLKLNERNYKVDAGFVQSAPAGALKLGDKVWRDDNGDGQQGVAEPGVAGVTAKLYQNGVDGLPGTLDDVLIATKTTDVDGAYLFTNLAASAGASTNYNVQFSNIPADFSFTVSDAGADATDNDANGNGKTGGYNLVADNLTVDAGLKQGTASGKGSLGNKVWIDLTGGTANVQDVNEPGVAGVTVNLYLDANGNGVISGAELTAVATTTTNALGEYIFQNLDAGTYQVGFSTLPAGYTLVTKDAGTNDNADSDGNPLNTSVSGNTAAAGTSYSGLTSLAQGEDNLSVDLGLTPPANTNTIGNFVWWDANSDGLQAGEQGVSGVSVTLYNNAGTAIATTVTDINGEYLFTGLADGTYSVGYSNLPAGFDLTSKSATNDLTGSDADRISGRTATVVLNYATGGTSRDNRSLDAGLVSTAAALGNKVWDDLNGDGVQDAAEPGVPGVTVTLYAADGTTVLSSAITDQNGNYLFANLNAGTYVLGFSTLPAGIEFTQQNTAGDNGNNTNSDAVPATAKTGQVVLSAGEIDLTIDAGIRSKPVATVGNRVWDDLDGDGLQDAGEPGIPGVIATLYNSLNQPIGSAVTDGNGMWLITNVPTGTGYYVIFSNKPLGNFTIQDNGGAGTGGGTDSDTDSDANAGGQTGAFDVTPNTINVKIDAGITYTIVLPIKLISFTAQPQGSNVLLNWVATDEVNVAAYSIEYSTNGISFTGTGSVTATNSRNYNFVHSAPVTGLNYYRLKTIDRNGDISYSEIRKVNFGKGSVVTVYPNPVKDVVNITLTGPMINKPATMAVLSMDGKLLLVQKTVAASQTETINVKGFASGKYIVQVTTAGEVINKTITIIH